LGEPINRVEMVGELEPIAPFEFDKPARIMAEPAA
jgi:hypothetical protein